MIRLILAIGILMVPSSLLAKKVRYFYDKDLPLGPNAVIKIIDYDHRLGGIYQGIGLKNPGEGYFYTRLENLQKSIKGLKIRAIKRSPASIVGKKFRTARSLETLLAPPVWPKRKVRKK